MKPATKAILFLIILAGLGFGAYRYLNASKDGGGGLLGLGSRKSNTVEGDQGLLGRPLRVGIVTWPGYAGGIVGNNGFKPNKECIYWKNHNLLVEFMLMEDVELRGKAFAKGGADGVDIVWSTVDFWANELPGFVKGGTDAKAIMQVDWSRGGDAIVVAPGINRIEDLVDKKISLALFTPSHWLLEYSLENSQLDDAQQERIVKALVGKNASPDARADFVAGKVDAAVVWEPDVTEALQKRAGSKVLLSSKTAANLIADLMVARTDFIKEHPDVIQAFVSGWMDGTAEANRRPELAANLLMDNEPLYKDLGFQTTLDQLSSVKWADLVDNTLMFGLNGQTPLFDQLFERASKAWIRRGYITQGVSGASARDIHFVKKVYDEAGTHVDPSTTQPKFPEKPPKRVETATPIMNKPVNIYFASGQAALDPNGKQVLDQIALTAQTFSNAYIRVVGNTDSRGSVATNVALSQQRAQAVVNYLVAKYGFTRSRFIAKGEGPNKPIADNGTEEGRAKNRRTDIQIVPK